MEASKVIRLCDLKVGQQGRVQSLHNEGAMRRRLLDIVLTPGTVTACVGRSPGGDPAAYRIRGAVIAIRDRDAADVTVEVDTYGAD